MPVIYKRGENRVYGIIDRVIIEDDTITVIDFKTHRQAPSEQQELAQTFSQQLGYYEQAAALLWPNKNIKSGILFTQNNLIIWL